ncbi:MAG: DUF308 domain-containing protein [Pseudomonadota bacterium]
MAYRLRSQSWWVPALRGAVALIFGVAALLWPSLTLLLLVGLFASYAILVGGISVIGAINARKRDERWWLVLLLGVVSIGAGVLAIAFPALTMLALVLLMGVNALVTGILDVLIAVRLRKVMHGEWLLLLGGVMSILFGLIVVAFPVDAGALALALLVSIYAIAIGLLFLLLAIKMRTWERDNKQGKHRPVST